MKNIKTSQGILNLLYNRLNHTLDVLEMKSEFVEMKNFNNNIL